MENKFIEGKILPILIKFTLPFLFANFLQSFYGAVDLFVVGQFSGTSAVSAVSIGAQMMQTVNCIVIALATGGTVLLGHAIGKKDNDLASKSITNLIRIFIVLAIILTPLMLIFTNQIISLVQTPSEAIEEARQYLFICSIGIPAIIGYNGVSAIIRGTGDSKTPMYIVIIVCIINIGFDFGLVAGAKMGVSGAAIATVVSQTIAFIIGVFYIKFHGLSVKFYLKDVLKRDSFCIKQTLVVGLPLAVQDTLVNLSFIGITTIVNTLGLYASSAVGVTEKILGFAFIIPSSFSQAYAIIASNNIGANKHDRVKKALWLSVLSSAVLGSIIFIYSQFLGNTLVSIFEKNEEVIALGASYLKSYSLDCILVSLIFNMNSYFSAYNKSYIAFIHSMIATFGFRLPFSYMFSKITGDSLYILGWAPPIASCFSIIFCLIAFVIINNKIMKKSHLNTLVEE